MKYTPSQPDVSQNMGKIEITASDEVDALLAPIFKFCKQVNKQKETPDTDADFPAEFQDTLNTINAIPGVRPLLDALLEAAIEGHIFNQRSFVYRSRKIPGGERIVTLDSGKRGSADYFTKCIQLILTLKDSDEQFQISWIDFQNGLYCHQEGGIAVISKEAITTLTSVEVADLLHSSDDMYRDLPRSIDPYMTMTTYVPIEDGVGESLSDFIDSAQRELGGRSGGRSPYSVMYDDFLAFCTVYKLPLVQENIQNIGGAQFFPDDPFSHVVDVEFTQNKQLIVYSPSRGPSGEDRLDDVMMGCEIIRTVLCLMKSSDPIIVNVLKTEIPAQQGDPPHWGVIRVNHDRLYCFDGQAAEEEVHKRHALIVNNQKNQPTMVK